MQIWSGFPFHKHRCWTLLLVPSPVQPLVGDVESVFMAIYLYLQFWSVCSVLGEKTQVDERSSGAEPPLACQSAFLAFQQHLWLTFCSHLLITKYYWKKTSWLHRLPMPSSCLSTPNTPPRHQQMSQKICWLHDPHILIRLDKWKKFRHLHVFLFER